MGDLTRSGFPRRATLRWSFGKNPEAITEKPDFEDLRLKSADAGKNNTKSPKGGQPSKSDLAPKN